MSGTPLVVTAAIMPVSTGGWLPMVRACGALAGGSVCGLESGDQLGGGSKDVGEELVAVKDAQGRVGGVDGDSRPGVVDADLDALAGDLDGAAAGDASLDRRRRPGDSRGVSRLMWSRTSISDVV
jgi:hypothetical protein